MKILNALRVLSLNSIPLRARCLLLLLRFLRGQLPRSDTAFLRLSITEVGFSKSRFFSDWGVFTEIFVHRCYDTDYRDSLVIDVGAHKGYYAAFVLEAGAREVWCYEPQTDNLSCLRRSASRFCSGGKDWRIYAQGLGSSIGQANLYVTSASWTHSLIRPAKGTPPVLGHEAVNITTLARVLTKARQHNSSHLILKIDIEGMECDVILSTPSKAFACVHEAFIEYHAPQHAKHAAPAPCSRNALVSRLQEAGLQLRSDQGEEIMWFTR
jgi:FkbM family methyltransferase